jgi:hygromycin-B 4-O-kinase
VKTRLAAREIQALVEDKLGPVSQFEPLPEGLASQAYGFRQAAMALVVRVTRSAEGFLKDAFAWRAFSSAALPIPEILSVDAFGEVSLCIARRAPGVRLRDVVDPADVSASVLDSLAALALADTSPTVGFGRFDAHGKAPHRNWQDYLLQVSKPDFCDWSLVQDRLDRQNVDSAILAIAALAPTDPPRRGLIHGDFGAANLLSDGQVITAVIDWDRALVGDVTYDQANVFFWREAPLQAVRAFISAERVGDADWARRMLCYQLRICLQELSESLEGPARPYVPWLFGRCADLVAEARRWR